MTTMILSNDKVKVNGRIIWDTRIISKLEKVSGGAWEGEDIDGNTFRIVGGFESGGGRNEWYLEMPLAFGEQSIPYTSAVACFQAMGRV